MRINPLFIPTLLLLATLCASAQDKVAEVFTPLFNGKDLSGWVNVNCAPSTWTWSEQDEMLVCTGKPTGELRTERMYQNFVLELEWRHLVPKGNAGVFVWADDITARGQPFIRGVEIQVLENAYGNTKGHTTHGDIFPIHGAKMTPLGGSRGMRAFPSERLSKPSPEWNHYRIECQDGKISLAVNGTVVTRGENCTPKKGYICLESEGGVVNYRNVRVRELPETPIEEKDIAIANRGYRSLYSGVDLAGWKEADGWKARDWNLVYQGKEESVLETEEAFGEGQYIVDVNFPKSWSAEASVGLAGVEIPIKRGKGWTRLEARVEANSVRYVINGGKEEVLPLSSNEKAPIRLKANGSVEFASIYVR